MQTPDRKTAPPVRDIDGIRRRQPRCLTLDNGLRLIIIDDPAFEQVMRLTVIRPGGVAHSPVKAVASLAASQLREGTSQLSSARIAETLEYNGAWLGALLAPLHTSLSLYTLNSCADKVVGLLRDMLCDPVMPESEFDTNRRRMAANTAVEMQRVAFRASRLSQQLTLGDTHPLVSHDTPDMILGADRAAALAFHRRGMRPAEMTVVAGGNIDASREKMLAEIFGSIPAAAPSDGPSFDMSLPLPAPGPDRSHYAMEGAMQTALRITIPTIGTMHPDFPALSTAVTALGGYFGSRLMTNIREEKGYTYGINAFVYTPSTDFGAITIVTECDNSYVDRVVAEVEHEIGRLVSEPPAGDELVCVRRTRLLEMAGMVDNPLNQAAACVNRLTVGNDDGYFERLLDEITSRTTTDRIGRMAARYIAGRPLIVASAGSGNS